MILTIDIGLRNLSLCCANCTDKNDLSTYNIHLWDVFNTLDSDDYHCQEFMKNGKVCNKKCSLKLNDNHYCKTHFPKNIQLTNKNIFKKKKVDEYLLQDISKIVIQKIQEIYNTNLDIFKQITHIYLELQPKIARKMVFVSHIIYGKLTELYFNTDTIIRFVRASEKLKAYTGPVVECTLKGAYAKRKFLSVQYTKWIIENKFNNTQQDKWLPFFNILSKQSDCGDTFCMMINALHGIPKKQKFQKNGLDIK